MTPAYLRELNPNNLPKLTRIESGGAAADAEVLSMWKKEKTVYNTYGPTEATVNAITFRLNEKNYTNIPIGKPVDNLSVYIVDNGRLCGVGMPGEICIAGVGLARGYLNQEELTNEKFVKNLFGEGRMYRTGDLGRWIEDGYVEYLGRIDEQVKIRGFRIELGEIETFIKNQQFITDAVVDSRKDKSGEPFLAGYFVAEQEIDIRKLKSNLQAVLPDYMVPAFLLQIDAIPLTQNGKVNKRQLPETVFGGIEEYVAPRTECEKLLVSIFEEVMGCERISVYDSFLDIGGNSIKAIGIASKVRDAGYQFAIKELMMNQNIEEMAAKLKLAEASIQVAMDYDYKRDSISKESMQNARVYKEVAKYHENVQNAEVECEYQPFGYQKNFLIREVANICPVKIKITGDITKGELMDTLNRLIEEHSVFRTVFCKDRESLLEYAYKGAWEIPYLEGNAEEDILYGDQILFQPELYKEGTLLAKLYVVKESEQVHILYAMVQHGIWDEFSGEIFLKMVEDKLIETTNATARKSTNEKIPFSDYAVKRRMQEESGNSEEMSQYLEEVKHYVSLYTSNAAGYLDAELEVSEQVVEEIRKKPVEWLVKLYQKFMEIDADTIPFVLMSHGRNDEQFAQLGLFLKMMPCIMRREELVTYDNCDIIEGELEGLEEEQYKWKLPLVNYYSQSGEAQLPELPESKIEIMESQESTGCLIRLGIINNRLFLQMPVSTMELDKYREILEAVLKR